MKKLQLLAITAAVAVTSVMGVAQAEVTENLSVTTNYIWRGVAQSGSEADVQGGIDWNADTGLYAGAWFSGSAAEVDLYVGWSSGMFDVGAVKYYYTQDDSAAAAEVYAGITVSDWTAKLYVDTDTDDSGDNAYLEITGDIGPVNINAGFNSNDLDVNEYAQLTVAYTHNNLTLAVAITDIDDADEEVSLTYNFPFE
ncbi:MAG: TorF family putative porin [Gammaproteobacteria bacterium]|nr:TorF family putative porin [Gammaproteobacteria bacterium]